MQTFISPFNNVIKIFHFPGSFYIERRNALKHYSTYKNFKCPKNITIITTANEAIKNSAILLQQLQRANINYINCVPDKTYNWNNRFKVQFILDTLKNVKTEYCLILDSLDVAIVNDLNTIVDDYLTYNVGVLYNGTTEEFPDCVIEEIENRVKKYGPFSFFNAGCCIGTVDALIQVYTEAQQIINNTNLEEDSHANSEQYFMRQVYANHLNDGLIGVDWQCKIFQCWRNIDFKPVKLINNRLIQYLTSSTDQNTVKKLIKKIKMDNAMSAEAAVDTDLTDEL